MDGSSGEDVQKRLREVGVYFPLTVNWNLVSNLSLFW